MSVLTQCLQHYSKESTKILINQSKIIPLKTKQFFQFCVYFLNLEFALIYYHLRNYTIFSCYIFCSWWSVLVNLLSVYVLCTSCTGHKVKVAHP